MSTESAPRQGGASGWVCPTCRKAVPADARWRPFCTERCKMVDLGGWFLGKYRIAAVDSDDDEPEARPAPVDDPD